MAPDAAPPALVCVRPPGWVGKEAQPFGSLVEWALRAEALGFDGLFVGDRLLAQAVDDGAGQVVYGASMLDATVVLSALAARTSRLRLGPLVLVFPYRHPVQLAKMVASLDVAADGRVVLGAGIGWNPVEFRVLGLPRSGRGPRFERDLVVVRQLWRGEAVVDPERGWDGDGVRIAPLPVQSGGPPVWLASFSPGQALDWGEDLPAPGRAVLDRVGRLADGWVPLIYSASSRRRLDAAALGRAWDEVLRSAVRAGRGRQDIDFVLSDWCYVIDGPGARQRCEAALARFFPGTWDEALRTYTIGSPQQVLDAIAAHVAHVDRVDAYILTPLSDELGQLEQLAVVAEGLRVAGGR